MAAKAVREAEMKCLCPDLSTLGGFVFLAIETRRESGWLGRLATLPIKVLSHTSVSEEKPDNEEIAQI